MPAARTIRGPRQLKAFMRKLPDVVADGLEEQSPRSAEEIAREARARAAHGPGVARVARYLEPTIQARDNVVAMGGYGLLPPRDGKARSGRTQTVNAVMMGAEMGSTRYDQFSPWRRDGYILGPAIDDDGADELANEHADAAVEAIRTA